MDQCSYKIQIVIFLMENGAYEGKNTWDPQKSQYNNDRFIFHSIGCCGSNNGFQGWKLKEIEIILTKGIQHID